MPKNYKHLSLQERELLAQLHWVGKSIGEIAKALDRNKSTISRELTRNKAPIHNRYTPCRAHARSCERKTDANSHERLKNDLIRQYVNDGQGCEGCLTKVLDVRRMQQPELTLYISM